MYYPCSENKGADQLHGHREADLRLCFRIGRLLVFSRTGSLAIMSCIFYLDSVNFKLLLLKYFALEHSLRVWKSIFMPNLM